MNAHSPLRLVADVGGTNARFALLDHEGRPSAVRVLPCERYPDIAVAIEAYLAESGSARPDEAAIAIANPVTGDLVTMTNHHWSFSQRELQARLHLRRLLVLNDFTALALALPVLSADELRQVGGGSAAPQAPIALIGPGTGLGVSGLVPGPGAWIPLSGEGGHATLAAGDDFEANLIGRLRQRFDHVSAERVLSGPGLVLLYETIAAMHNAVAEKRTPAEITARALAGEDALCRLAAATFCALLGSVAGNLALTLGARGGVYIGGGIVPQLGEFLLRSPFRARFESKGRFAGYLAAIPCYVIHSPYPGLLGAGRAFESSAENQA
jgi:glucokinase